MRFGIDFFTSARSKLIWRVRRVSRLNRAGSAQAAGPVTQFFAPRWVSFMVIGSGLAHWCCLMNKESVLGPQGRFFLMIAGFAVAP